MQIRTADEPQQIHAAINDKGKTHAYQIDGRRELASSKELEIGCDGGRVGLMRSSPGGKVMTT